MKSAAQVAKELNLPASTLSLWIAKGLVETTGGRGRGGCGVTEKGESQAKRLTEIRAEIARLQKAFEPQGEE